MPTPARKPARTSARTSAPKPTRTSARRKAPATAKGLVRVPVRLEAAQLSALEHEARRRNRAGRQHRTDASEVLREAVSVWMAIRPAQRAIIRAVAARRELTRPEVLREALDAWLTSLDPSKL